MAEPNQFGTVYARLDAYGALWLEGPNSAGDYYVWYGSECDFEGVREIISGDELATMMLYFEAAAKVGGPIHVGRIEIRHSKGFTDWLRERMNPTRAALEQVSSADFSEFVKSGGRY